MRISAIARKATEEGALLIRFRERTVDKFYEYDVKPLFTGKKKGWMIFDHFTASAIMAVYNGLNETNQSRFDIIPLPKLLELVWKSVGTTRSSNP